MQNHCIPEARLRCLAERIYALGPRPLFELFCELERGADFGSRLERYAQLDPAVIAAIGANVLPATALLIAGGGNG